MAVLMAYQAATAAPHPIRFESDEGPVEFRMTPLTDRDLAEMDEWVRAEVIRNARRSLEGITDPDQREETLSIAMRVAAETSWMSKRGARLMGTVDGMTQLVWQSIKREHPTVTKDQLRALMFSPANIREANQAFARLNAAEGGAARAGKQGPADSRLPRGTSTGD